jgi:uncharacterized membrane protein YqjE
MHSVQNSRSLAEMVADIKDEIRDFAQTRIQLFTVEFKEKLALLKIAAVLAVAAVFLLSTAYLLFTLGTVALVAALFRDNPYHWVFGFVGVALLWAIIGGIAAYFAKRQFAVKGIVPTRTFEVLRGDKIWLQHEAKDHL